MMFDNIGLNHTQNPHSGYCSWLEPSRQEQNWDLNNKKRCQHITGCQVTPKCLSTDQCWHQHIIFMRLSLACAIVGHSMAFWREKGALCCCDNSPTPTLPPFLSPPPLPVLSHKQLDSKAIWTVQTVGHFMPPGAREHKC